MSLQLKKWEETDKGKEIQSLRKQLKHIEKREIRAKKRSELGIKPKEMEYQFPLVFTNKVEMLYDLAQHLLVRGKPTTLKKEEVEVTHDFFVGHYVSKLRNVALTIGYESNLVYRL